MVKSYMPIHPNIYFLTDFFRLVGQIIFVPMGFDEVGLLRQNFTKISERAAEFAVLSDCVP